MAENVAGGTVTFTAALDRAVGSDVVLDVAVTAGTATLADDPGASLPTTVTITEGNLTGTFTVPITNDNIVEGNETFRGSVMKTLTLSETLGSGAAAAGDQLGKTRWGSWIDGSYAGFGGKATGRQADVYGGVDYLGGNGKWLYVQLAAP